MHDLVLDRAVRDWVLLPLTLSVVLMMVLRQYIAKLTAGGQPQGKVDTKELREKQQLARSQVLRANAGFIPEAAFRERRQYFAAKETGVLVQKTESRPPHEMMMSNPDMMMNMMKGNLTGFLPQIAMGMFVSHFFAGFIILRIPLPLSPSFRPMLQRGIELPGLDVSYLTSLSFYMLLLFGLRGVFMLVFREETIDDTQVYQQQMAAMGGGPAGMVDLKKAFEAEQKALELTGWKGRLESSEQQAAELLRRSLSP